MSKDNLRVINNSESNRYEIYENDTLAGYAAYDLSESIITFTHTEIEPSFEGQGYADTLVRTMLEDVRESTARSVEPVCPFVDDFINHHPEYRDLLSR